jgi:hypothetical protein
LRPDIDREILLTIIAENPGVVFDCWGSYQVKQTNIGGAEDEATLAFIRQLQSNKNVVMHGPVPPDKLAPALHETDGFLVCYDVKKDQSKGTNYHKVIEYLSTGKVIISNNITTYQEQSVLVQMIRERDHNDTLPGLFKKVISRLEDYNTAGLQQQRIAFAHDNTYKKQIERISKLISHGE